MLTGKESITSPAAVFIQVFITLISIQESYFSSKQIDFKNFGQPINAWNEWEVIKKASLITDLSISSLSDTK